MLALSLPLPQNYTLYITNTIHISYKTLKKSRIRETPNLSTGADNSTNIFFSNFFKIFFFETTPRFKALQVSPQMHQSNTSHAWTIHGCNLEQLLIFKSLQVGWQMQQSTSQTPPTRGQSMYAIQDNSLFLGLFRVGWRDSSEFPRVDDPQMQTGTTPFF